MKINNECIKKSEEYLKSTFENSKYLTVHPSERENIGYNILIGLRI